MRKLRRCVCLILLLSPFASAALAQDGAARGRIVVALPRGGFVAFEHRTIATSTEQEIASRPDLPALAPQFLVEETTVHRLLVGEGGGFIFGYDLVVTPLAQGGFGVVARPLDTALEAKLRARAAAGGEQAGANVSNVSTISTLARATESRVVADGDSLALDLLVNNAAGIKIVDYVKIASRRERLFDPRPAPEGAPRDFAITNVELALKDFRLVIDGAEAQAVSPRRSCRGSLVWLHLPEVGRFIFSLAPRDGYDFRKTATVRGDRIIFEWQGRRYEWVSREPVIAGAGTWNLWMLHDPVGANAYEVAPPDLKNDRPSELARVLSDRVKRSTGFEAGASSRPPRMRVRIGGSERIETLLQPRR